MSLRLQWRPLSWLSPQRTWLVSGTFTNLHGVALGNSASQALQGAMVVAQSQQGKNFNYVSFMSAHHALYALTYVPMSGLHLSRALATMGLLLLAGLASLAAAVFLKRA